MSNTLARLVCALLAIGLGIATAIHGYGLTVQSWGWIILGNIGAGLLIAISQGDR